MIHIKSLTLLSKQTDTLYAACSPWTVNRAAKLLEWYNSGEYEKIINK